MSEHIYQKNDLIQKFDGILDKTFEEIDNIDFFARVQQFKLQKGVAGSVIEQCVMGYSPDSKQEADLLIIDGELEFETELKTTGMRISNDGGQHFVAKEPMSITAVGIYDLAEQKFETSHFWNKLNHMLIVYYHYDSECAVSPYEYRLFRVKGFEFHEFSEDEKIALNEDWKCVHALITNIVENYSGEKTKEWKELVKKEYIERHGVLRRQLSYIDLAPKFPPRFRLKKPTVSTMISKHFGYELEQLPGRYATILDIDKKCHEITLQYKGKTIASLIKHFDIQYNSNSENKGITEQIAVAMFDGKSKKLNEIELFQKFGLIAKSIVMTSKGGRTEDMKLFHVDFSEIVQSEFKDDCGNNREFQFEDSELYTYFSNHEFLCIIYEEDDENGHQHLSKTSKIQKNKLGQNKFIGFKRLIFSDEFIEKVVKSAWTDTRNKVLNKTLVDVVSTDKNGAEIVNKSGLLKSAPNFIKSKENPVFLRGAGTNSSEKAKTECVNGIKMLPQYIWVKGKTIVEKLDKTPEI